jgi:hypothetical protein
MIIYTRAKIRTLISRNPGGSQKMMNSQIQALRVVPKRRRRMNRTRK